MHLDRGKLTIYRGGYTSFARQYAEKRALQAKAKAKQDAERAQLQSFIDRFKAKATKARQAQSRMKRLAKTPSSEVSRKTGISAPACGTSMVMARVKS